MESHREQNGHPPCLKTWKRGWQESKGGGILEAGKKKDASPKARQTRVEGKEGEKHPQG